jgi:hypothetical protein
MFRNSAPKLLNDLSRLLPTPPSRQKLIVSGPKSVLLATLPTINIPTIPLGPRLDVARRYPRAVTFSVNEFPSRRFTQSLFEIP